MGKLADTVYRPIPAHTAAYDRLYSEYTLLHDWLGRGGNQVMKRLRTMRSQANREIGKGLLQ